MGDGFDDDRLGIVDPRAASKSRVLFDVGFGLNVVRYSCSSRMRQVLLQTRVFRIYVLRLVGLVALTQSVTVVDAANRFARVACNRPETAGPYPKSEPAGQVLQFGLVLRQFVRLLVVHQLRVPACSMVRKKT